MGEHTEPFVAAVPLAPGPFVPGEPTAYRSVGMLRRQRDLGEPCYGVPRVVCPAAVSRTSAACPGRSR